MLTRIHYQKKRADGSGGGRGRRVGGLLRYLFGPGRSEEHVNTRFGEAEQMGTPYGRLVAASGGERLSDLQPAKTALGNFDYRHLVQWLEEPVRAAGVLRRVDGRQTGPGWVWHASMRLAPEDRHRVLSDETWAHMVGEMLRGAGLVVDGDDTGVRWVAVRHAEDHVHIVATLVREDGRREWFGNDYPRCVDATEEVAARMGLRQVPRGQRTTHRRPHPMEVHKAARKGRFTGDGGVLTVRDELRRRVRAAAAAACSPEEFVSQLHRQGVNADFRESQTTRGRHTGVKFHLEGDTTAAGAPVWYGGGRLAPDLTWPKLSTRWAAQPLPGLDAATVAAAQDPARVLSEAERIVRRAAGRIRRGSSADADEIGQAAADCMTAGAWLLEQAPDGRLVEAAERFDAATRRPGGERPRVVGGDAWRLHMLANALFALQLASDDEDERSTLLMMYSLCMLADRIAVLHEQQHRTGQAAHARAAAAGIRAAAEKVPLRERGRRMDPAQRHRLADALQQALPEHAGRILSEPGWYALAATLRDIEQRGEDPWAVLRVVAARRELRTAESVSDVLMWRLRRHFMLDFSGPVVPGRRRPRRSTNRTTGGRARVFVSQQRPPSR